MRNILAALAVSTLCLTSAAVAQQTPTPSVQSVLATTAEALGAKNLKDLPSYHATATGTAVGLPGKLEAYTELGRGGRFAQYVTLPQFTNDTGYDGRDAWTRDDAGVVWVDGSEQGHAAAVNEAFRESYALWTPDRGGATVALAPAKTEGAVAYDIVRVSAPGSVVPFDVWIDRATHLPSRYVEVAASISTTTTLGDYRSVAGVKLPYSIKQVSDQGNESDFKISSIEVAPPALVARLSKPASAPHDFSIAGASETTVPFDLIDNHVFVNVMLDGKGPYRFIFDTGGSNVVDPAVVKEIGKATEGSVQGSGVGAATETASFTKIASLRVGAAELVNQDFAVLPVRAGFGIASSAPVDGIIGSEVLARFVTVFDYSQNRVTLKLPGAKVAGTAVPFVFAGTQPQIACAIDGVATQCTIDSGSRSSIDLFSPFIAENPSVVPAKMAAPGLNGFGVGGGDIGSLGRLSSLEIGGFDLKNVVAGYSQATAGAFSVPGIGANIGGGVLKRFTVTYDYRNQTMGLLANASLTAPDSYERSGMFVINRGQLIVAAVRPGTPAAQAGIVKGDMIQSVGKLSGSQLTLGNLRQALAAPSGTSVQLGIVHKGATTPQLVTIVLHDYV